MGRAVYKVAIVIPKAEEIPPQLTTRLEKERNDNRLYTEIKARHKLDHLT